MISQPKWGWIGLAAFGTSYGLSNLFVLVDSYESAVILWFAGLYGVLGMYAGLRVIQTGQWDAVILWSILLGANAFTRQVTDFWAEYSLGPRLWSLALLICIAGLVWQIFREFTKRQLFERLIWAVILIAFEGWAVLEYGACKVIADDAPQAWLAEHWGHDVSKYSCRRWAGEWWPQIDQILTALALAYITGHWLWARWRLRYGR